ncbi:MAG: peroxiredoxin [Nitrososphaerota archaeon]
MLKEGDLAPDFALESHDGVVVRLSRFSGRPVVIFFYPKDGSIGCTEENCLFRDMMPEFRRVGAVVLGISRDSLESHRRFARKHGLGHLLLSDSDGSVCRAYGVLGLFGLVGRVTYVVDGAGRVRRIIRGWSPSRHVAGALEAVRELSMGAI